MDRLGFPAALCLWFVAAGAAPAAAGSPFFLHDSSAWNPAFFPKGLDGAAYHLAPSGAGFYAIGEFGRADSLPAAYAARWDGARWVSAFPKPPFRIDLLFGALADGSDLYLSGLHSSCASILKWNGTSWDSVFAESHIANPQCIWQGRLLFSDQGPFDQGFWLWDAGAAKPFGPRFSGHASATVAAGDLWLLGSFELKGDTSVRNFAVWRDGTWKHPGGDTVGPISSWTWFHDTAYALVSSTGDGDSLHVMRREGATWKTLAMGSGPGHLRHVASDSQHLFLIGAASETGSAGDFGGPLLSGLRIGDWVTGAYIPVDGFTGKIMEARCLDGGLVIAGTFSRVGRVRADNVARYDFAKGWTAFSDVASPGATERVNAFASDGARLYLAGELTSAGDSAATGVAAWDGKAWDSFGGGPPGLAARPVVSALAVAGGAVYAGGRFALAAGSPLPGTQTPGTQGIAMWSNGAWTYLAGYDHTPHAILPLGPDLYASDGQNVSRWKGGAWTRIGPDRDIALRLVAFQGKPWVADNNELLRWNENSWDAFPIDSAGRTVYTQIVDLAVFRDALFAATGEGVYRFDGAAWTRLPGCRNATHLASGGADLFVSGPAILDDSATTLARWDGKAWLPLSGGETGLQPDDMLVHGGDLYLMFNGPPYGREELGYLARWRRSDGSWSIPAPRRAGRPRGWISVACPNRCADGARPRFDFSGRRLAVPAAGVSLRAR